MALTALGQVEDDAIVADGCQRLCTIVMGKVTAAPLAVIIPDYLVSTDARCSVRYTAVPALPKPGILASVHALDVVTEEEEEEQSAPP